MCQNNICIEKPCCHYLHDMIWNTNFYTTLKLELFRTNQHTGVQKPCNLTYNGLFSLLAIARTKEQLAQTRSNLYYCQINLLHNEIAFSNRNWGISGSGNKSVNTRLIRLFHQEIGQYKWNIRYTQFILHQLNTIPTLVTSKTKLLSFFLHYQKYQPPDFIIETSNTSYFDFNGTSKIITCWFDTKRSFCSNAHSYLHIIGNCIQIYKKFKLFLVCKWLPSKWLPRYACKLWIFIGSPWGAKGEF